METNHEPSDNMQAGVRKLTAEQLASMRFPNRKQQKPPRERSEAIYADEPYEHKPFTYTEPDYDKVCEMLVGKRLGDIVYFPDFQIPEESDWTVSVQGQRIRRIAPHGEPREMMKQYSSVILRATRKHRMKVAHCVWVRHKNGTRIPRITVK